MNKFLLTALTWGMIITASAQEKFTISGTIKSKKNGETLIGASIRTGTAGTTSNEYGFYSLTLPQGEYLLEASAVGMGIFSRQLNLTGDITLNILLEEEAKSLENITITATSKNRSLSAPQMGVEKVTTREIRNIPVLLGERDILKTIQLLPGIKSAGDGNSGFFVRGGSADQNLILLDEANVYNASHLLGFFSTFNSDAIKDITVYKGGMPAQYGGRLSSVLDIKMNDGNSQDYEVSGGIGLISAKLNVEGPIQKDKASFLVTGRRTYADMFLKLSNDTVLKNSRLYFYDLNAKVNYTLGEKDRLYLSGYFGQDVLGAGDRFGIHWGNATGTLRWNHIYNSKLFSNTSLILSNYNYKISIASEGVNFDILSQINDWNLKHEFQWFLNNKNNIRIGLNTIYHTLRPGEVRPSSEKSSINIRLLQHRYSWENSIYATNTWKTSDRINITYGLRLTSFSVLGAGDYFVLDEDRNVSDTLRYKKGEFVKTYINPEPRLAVSYRLGATSSVKGAYARNVQNLHLLSNSTTSNPTDKWVASTNIIKPEISDMVSLGYYKDLADDYELTTEVYYKTMQNQIDYKDGADIFINTDAVETQLLFGRGRAYGWELQLKKKAGRLTGWLSYTLSKTEKQIDGINHNQWYNARQDRTHDIAIVASYELSKKWSVSANWVFNTGNAVSFPTGKYEIDGRVAFYYTERNGYRMPAYHRLDIGANWILKQRKKFSSELSFSLYNAYGRQNAYTISFQQSETDPEKTEAVQLALFRFIPSVSYNFKF